MTEIDEFTAQLRGETEPAAERIREILTEEPRKSSAQDPTRYIGGL